MREELKRIKSSFEIQTKHKPKKLYKYRCFNDHTIDSIRNDYLWLSKPSSLNDPFESFVNDNFNPNKLIEFVEDYNFFDDTNLTEKWHSRVEEGENIIEVLKQIIDNIEDEKEKITAMDKLYYCYRDMCEFYMESAVDFTQDMDKSFLIGSLTTDPLSITMWSHYASSHEGICIEYDLSENPYIEKMVYPVIYTETTLSHDDIFDNDLMLFAMLFKSPDWKYEKEWRVLYPTQHSKIYAKPSAIYLGARGWCDNKLLKSVHLLAKEKNVDLHIVYKSGSSYKLQEFNFDEENRNKSNE